MLDRRMNHQPKRGPPEFVGGTKYLTCPSCGRPEASHHPDCRIPRADEATARYIRAMCRDERLD